MHFRIAYLIERNAIVKTLNLKNLKLNLIKYDVEKMINLHDNLYDKKSYFRKCSNKRKRRNEQKTIF